MKNVYKQLKPILIIVSVICLITTTLEVIRTGIFNWPVLKEQLFYNAYYGIPITLIIGSFFEYANRLINWDERPKARVVVGVLGTIVITMLLLIVLNAFLWVYLEGKSWSSVLSRDKYFFYLVGLVITLMVTAVMHAIGFYQETQRQKEDLHNMEKQKLISELNTLKANVDPHFLFNSFNVLSGLIDENPEKAQSFLTGLSKIYRYVLEQRNEDSSKLEDEIAFARRYLDLQKTRFEKGINLVIDIPPSYLDKEIPSLSLQLLLENAIKHNAFDKDNPLHINIMVQDDQLIVENNIRPRSESVASSGIGLQNIKDRYTLLAGKEIDIHQSQNQFVIKLPLL